MDGPAPPSALSVTPNTYRIDGRSHLVEGVHALCDEWEREGWWDGLLGGEGRARLRLVLHEWAANLVQHARFERPIIVNLTVCPHRNRLFVVVEDNTDGFDYDAQVRESIEEIAVTMPDRGMGLALVRACAESVHYERRGAACNWLVLSLKGRACAGPATVVEFMKGVQEGPAEQWRACSPDRHAPQYVGTAPSTSSLHALIPPFRLDAL